MKKTLLLIPAISLLCIACALLFMKRDKSEILRSDYESFIISKGKSFTGLLSQPGNNNPSPDRPDAAAFAEFIKTFDPELRRVPAERRIEAMEITDHINRLK